MRLTSSPALVNFRTEFLEGEPRAVFFAAGSPGGSPSNNYRSFAFQPATVV